MSSSRPVLLHRISHLALETAVSSVRKDQLTKAGNGSHVFEQKSLSPGAALIRTAVAKRGTKLHSYRSATIGSQREARRAGQYAATSDAININRAAASSEAGS
jgi:hypothetical protein